MEVGVILGDQWTSVPPREHLRGLLAQVEAAQRNGVTLLTLGQHFVYPDVRWLQPVPTLARISAELDPDVRIATTIVIVPLYHPIALAEELATLDIVSDGRLVVGAGLGYRAEEFTLLGVEMKERVARFSPIRRSKWIRLAEVPKKRSPLRDEEATFLYNLLTLFT